MQTDCVILGGGAGGLCAAAALGRRGLRVTVVERLPRVGKKLLATGNGRCNLSNLDMQPSHYGKAAPFVERVYAAVPPEEVAAFFASLGLMTAVEDGRVYPNRMDGIGCGTAIFRNYDRRFSGALERSRSRRTLPVEAAVEVTRNRISVTFSDGSSQATASRDGRFDEALDPLRAERTVRAQTAKTGDTSYEVCRIEVRWDMPRFVPVSLLNELRREALSRLDAGRAACYVRRSRREENLRALFPDTELSAEENVVNSLAAGFYREHGVRRIEPGFDAGPIPEG